MLFIVGIVVLNLFPCTSLHFLYCNVKLVCTVHLWRPSLYVSGVARRIQTPNVFLPAMNTNSQKNSKRPIIELLCCKQLFIYIFCSLEFLKIEPLNWTVLLYFYFSLWYCKCKCIKLCKLYIWGIKSKLLERNVFKPSWVPAA